AASKMGFITSPDGDGYTGDDLEDTHAPVMSAEPGSFEQLPQGMDIKLFDPTHPTYSRRPPNSGEVTCVPL
ncbi:MAG: hypothetical protein OSB41_15740, partial [Kiritimatiellae bacterium]|nr:hypothetical protein [Kiritimatiellia bacterium]